MKEYSVIVDSVFLLASAYWSCLIIVMGLCAVFSARLKDERNKWAHCLRRYIACFLIYSLCIAATAFLDSMIQCTLSAFFVKFGVAGKPLVTLCLFALLCSKELLECLHFTENRTQL